MKTVGSQLKMTATRQNCGLRRSSRRLAAGMIGLVFLCISSFFVCQPAYAADTFHSSAPLLVIPQGARVSHLFAVGENVDIKGVVQGVVVVIDGNLVVSSTAQTGHILDVGGTLKIMPGARTQSFAVFGDVGYLQQNFLFSMVLTILTLFSSLFLSLLTALFAVVCAWVFPDLTTHMRRQLHLSFRQSLLVGLSGLLMILGLMGILALTDILLPLAIIIGILVLLLLGVGLAGSVQWFGYLIEMNTDWPLSRNLRLWLGAVALWLIFNIPIVGPLGAIVLATAGLGTLIGLALRTRLRRASE